MGFARQMAEPSTIFLPETNRTVSVQAGGVVAVLEYIYKTDRLVNELLGSK
ncbi:MAG: hypothetical protein ACK5VK_14855 [Cyclobacteriaceae bacterium]